MTQLFKLPEGQKFTFPGDPEVYVTGRKDGACVNVYHSDDFSWCGPVFAWQEVEPIEEEEKAGPVANGT